MTSSAELGARIREARLDKSMSLGQLASAVGRSSSSVRRWERGEVAPAVSVVPKLAAILDIDPNDLRAGTPASDSADGSPDSTIEQPVVDEDAAPEVVVSQTPAESARTDTGRMADAWRAVTGGGRGWIGWLRGLLTAGILLAMLFVLVWAVGELFDALRDVWDSFEAGTGGS